MTERNHVLKVAGIGAGYFSQFHYDAWDRIPRAELVAIADRELDRASKWSCNAYDRLGEMLERENPDIVDIIVPPGEHLKCIEESIYAGVKTIICQKPFCGNLESARVAVELAEKYDCTLVVHENFRFQPWYRVIKNAMGDGLIGNLQQVTFRLRPGDGQGPQAYLDRQPYFQSMDRFLIHETGIHWIDTFRYLCGEPESVYADLRKMNDAISGEDAGYFILSFGAGVRALFDGNRLVDHIAENTRCTMGEALVEGTAGSLELDGNGAVSFRRNGEQHSEMLLEPDRSTGFGGDCVHTIQSHIVDGIIDGEKIENLGREYLTNMEIEELIYQSALSGQKMVVGN